MEIWDLEILKYWKRASHTSWTFGIYLWANISMISGFWDPWEPLFMDLNIPNYIKTSKNTYGNNYWTYWFYKSQDLEHSKIWTCWKGWRHQHWLNLNLNFGGSKTIFNLDRFDKNRKRDGGISIKSLKAWNIFDNLKA